MNLELCLTDYVIRMVTQRCIICFLQSRIPRAKLVTASTLQTELKFELFCLPIGCHRDCNSVVTALALLNGEEINCIIERAYQFAPSSSHPFHAGFTAREKMDGLHKSFSSLQHGPLLFQNICFTNGSLFLSHRNRYIILLLPSTRHPVIQHTSACHVPSSCAIREFVG